ncbi:MAG TPA: hypothetical protein VGH25_15080, partial [Dongiaceae bacterium]
MPDSWWNTLWGNSPPPSPPRHPSSRGALLGLNYRAMPDMKAPIEDQRGNIPETLPPLWGQAAEDAEALSRYPPGSHILNKDAWDWREAHMPGDLPTTPLEDPGTAERPGFADGGAPDPLDGWTAEPVDHDPFQRTGGLDDDGVASGATGEPNAQSAAPEMGPLGRSGGTGGGEGLQPAPGEASAPGGLSPEQSAEIARSRAAAGPYQPVTGLPQKGIILADGSHYIPGPLEKAHRAAEAYMAESGLPYDPPRDYAKIDKNFGARLAQAYEDMPHDPHNPAVKSAYDALARETMAQWQHVK